MCRMVIRGEVTDEHAVFFFFGLGTCNYAEHRLHRSYHCTLYSNCRKRIDQSGVENIFLGFWDYQFIFLYRNKHVKTWNEGLLYVAGYLARTVYEHEMDDLKTYSTLDTFESRGLHILRFFSFHESTPKARVSHHIQDVFFQNCMHLPIVSSISVYPACQVRDHNQDCALFIKGVPMLSYSVATHSTIVDVLKQKSILSAINLNDILGEMKHTLDEEVVLACLKWVIDTNLISPAKALSLIVVPRFSRHSTLSKPDSIMPSLFSERVFLVLARTWKILPNEEKEAIRRVLEKQPCVPSTQQGMKLPEEAYLSDLITSAFMDLPSVILKEPMHGQLEEVVSSFAECLLI